MTIEDYAEKFDEQIDCVFKTQCKEFEDWRPRYGFLRGWIGNPFSGVWFLAEKPSLSMVQRQEGRGYRDDPNAQFNASDGDRIFRDALNRYGFTTGPSVSPTAWRCYVTNVIKAPKFVKAWKELPPETRNRIAESWSPVLSWELRTAVPAAIVLMGDKANSYVDHLAAKGLLPDIPRRMRISHYARFNYPDNNFTVENYDREFRSLVKSLESAGVRW